MPLCCMCPICLLCMRPLQLWLKTREPKRAWAQGGKHVTITSSYLKALRPWGNPNLFSRGVQLVGYQEESGHDGHVIDGLGIFATALQFWATVWRDEDIVEHKLT